MSGTPIQRRFDCDICGPLKGCGASGDNDAGNGGELLSDNEKVEQLAANNFTIPQDPIASLLQRLVRHGPCLQRDKRPQ